MSSEQFLHDSINLRRLVRRLEKSVSSKEWDEAFDKENEQTPVKQRNAWIEATGAVEQVKFAKKLLKSVQLYDPDLSPERSSEYEAIANKLEVLLELAEKREQRLTPKRPRPKPLLSLIPKPTPPPQPPAAEEFEPPEKLSTEIPEQAVESSRPSANPEQTETPQPSADNLLLSPTERLPNLAGSAPVLIPSALPPGATSSTTATTTPRFLQNTQAIQQELQDQLAEMATQLRRNALHFSSALEKDQRVLQDADGKLESNFDVMQKERKRLRDHRGKSWNTTFLTMGIIVLVILVFVAMVWVIRFT